VIVEPEPKTIRPGAIRLGAAEDDRFRRQRQYRPVAAPVRCLDIVGRVVLRVEGAFNVLVGAFYANLGPHLNDLLDGIFAGSTRGIGALDRKGDRLAAILILAEALAILGRVAGIIQHFIGTVGVKIDVCLAQLLIELR
jgi:hypothetical protein